MFCPPFVFGPPVHEIPSVEKFEGTQSQLYNRVVKGELGEELGRLTTFGCVIELCSAGEEVRSLT